MSRYYARNRSIIGNYYTTGGIPGGDQGFGNYTYEESLIGGVTYALPGSYTWTCPVGVTSVSILCVGGGGGGQSSSSGGGASPPTAGGQSTFISTSVCYAGGGAVGISGVFDPVTPANGATAYYGLTAGGSGGNAPYKPAFVAGGGGGSGQLFSGTAASGSNFDWGGQGGFGINIYSAGSSNAGGAGSNVSDAAGGVGGNYGAGGGGGRDGSGGGGGAIAWANSYTVTPGSGYSVVVGAGGLGANYAATTRRGGNGGRGCVRIIWGRTFVAGANITAISETIIS